MLSTSLSSRKLHLPKLSSALHCYSFLQKEQGERVVLSNPSRLVDSTSEFRKEELESLRIQYSEIDALFDVKVDNIPNYFYIRDYNNRDQIYNKSQILNADRELLVGEERCLIKYLNKVVRNEEVVKGTSESNTDSLVDYMIRQVGFDREPFILRLHPYYKFYVGSHEISSVPGFSVENDELMVFIDEDKHLRNTGKPKSWGEYQIAGEILAAAYTNHEIVFTRSCEINGATIAKEDEKEQERREEIMYAMRVIGTKFTFYKAIIPHSYLISLGSGLPDK